MKPHISGIRDGNKIVVEVVVLNITASHASMRDFHIFRKILKTCFQNFHNRYLDEESVGFEERDSHIKICRGVKDRQILDPP